MRRSFLAMARLWARMRRAQRRRHLRVLPQLLRMAAMRALCDAILLVRVARNERQRTLLLSTTLRLYTVTRFLSLRMRRITRFFCLRMCFTTLL
jgi:hypothetical protein